MDHWAALQKVKMRMHLVCAGTTIYYMYVHSYIRMCISNGYILLDIFINGMVRIYSQWCSQTECDGRAQHNPMHTF